MTVIPLVPDSIPILDIRILDGNDQENIWKILKSVFPNWSKEYTKMKPLEEGLSNIVLRFDHDNKIDEPKTILMRIRTRLADFIVNRWDEIKHMHLLHELGGEQKLYAVFQNGLVYSFIKGSTISVDKFSVPKYSELIIEQVARLHSLPTRETMLRLFPSEVNDSSKLYTKPVLFPTIRKWIEKLPTGYNNDKQKFERLKNEFPSKTVLLNEVAYLEKLLKNPISPVVLCHNDLLAGNIVMPPDENRRLFNISISLSLFVCVYLFFTCHKKESVHFIDFEYCGFNHAAFDIGNHFCEFAEYQRMWISKYLKAKNHYEKKFNQQTEVIHNGYSTTPIMINSHSNHMDQDHNNSSNNNNNCENESLLEKWLIEVNNFALSAHLFWGVWAVILSVQEQTKFDYLS
uniref:ethanolamine kinase n=1 Tax=Schistosoma haematobium TaxID=6185 RepID=A0A095BUM5_SCHHA